jgi:hypothetical protein
VRSHYIRAADAARIVEVAKIVGNFIAVFWHRF